MWLPSTILKGSGRSLWSPAACIVFCCWKQIQASRTDEESYCYNRKYWTYTYAQILCTCRNGAPKAQRMATLNTINTCTNALLCVWACLERESGCTYCGTIVIKSIRATCPRISVRRVCVCVCFDGIVFNTHTHARSPTHTSQIMWCHWTETGALRHFYTRRCLLVCACVFVSLSFFFLVCVLLVSSPSRAMFGRCDNNAPERKRGRV